MEQSKLTQQAKEAIDYAEHIMVQFNHKYLGTEHMLVGLAHVDGSISKTALNNQQIKEDDLVQKIREIIGKGSAGDKTQVGFTPRMKLLLDKSDKLAKQLGTTEVGTEHILMVLLKEPQSVAIRILELLKVDTTKLYISLNNIVVGDKIKDINFNINSMKENKASLTPTLDKFSRDFTQLALGEKFDPVIGRELEIERMIQILSRRTKNNPCLIGEPGVGKTAVVEGLAQKIVIGAVPSILKNRRVVSLDLSSLVAGTRYRGEFEERINKVIKEIVDAGDLILFIDELHTIIGAGSAEGTMDASNILKPSLARGDLQLIGATTLSEYRKYIEKDAALERRFQPVMIEEPTSAETLEILEGIKKHYENHHQVTISEGALKSAVKLSKRYINDRFLPDKAIDLIDEAASRVRLRAYTSPEKIKETELNLLKVSSQKEEAIIEEEYEKAASIKKEENLLKEKLIKLTKDWEDKQTKSNQIVTDEDVADVVSSWVNIPVNRLNSEDTAKLKNLEKELHERIIGQDEAIVSVSKAVRRGRVGLKDPNRPIGSFLFLGPTGVGKTELTKALAFTLFGNEHAMIRIDMSEYMEKHSVSKLIGSPPGYVGFEEGGQITEKIRKKPYSVILLDEIEKAHPDVFNMLLQILDDGHVTDSKGRKVDFKNTIIIMTSNIGATQITAPKRVGFVDTTNADREYKDMKKTVMEEVKKLFKPEFLNRLDETIVFHPLTTGNIEEIAQVMTKSLINRISKNVGVNLKLSESAIKLLAKKGYDQAYGARPLKRVIQSEIEDKLADKMLEGKILEGDNVKVKVKEEKLIFTK
ncbi:ATP-dependent Clp protease ATP-binding subunit [Candidatus Epulonipiscium viviparus]|uniref:ATP-dependent Clp protease ATP-binding subunit n=1 Tax=Candidatus Epulonipiscium viviparus TaxID=420336 RepID=UPI002738117A|nr:ATP-dependent Clp protease ATP-binding subunit [Candidatus Epulopiscium viviparus]